MSVSEVRIISDYPVKFVGPGVNDGLSIEEVHCGHDAILEFLFGCDANVAQDGARELRKETFDEVEPGAMGWREGEFEAMCRLLRNPGSGLFGDVRGMIVEDQLDRRVDRIGGIKELEEFDEFAAAITVPDQGVNLAAVEVDAGQQAHRAVAFIFKLACEGGVHAGLGRQIRSGGCDSLNARL